MEPVEMILNTAPGSSPGFTANESLEAGRLRADAVQVLAAALVRAVGVVHTTGEAGLVDREAGRRRGEDRRRRHQGTGDGRGRGRRADRRSRESLHRGRWDSPGQDTARGGEAQQEKDGG